MLTRKWCLHQTGSRDWRSQRLGTRDSNGSEIVNSGRHKMRKPGFGCSCPLQISGLDRGHIKWALFQPPASHHCELLIQHACSALRCSYATECENASVKSQEFQQRWRAIKNLLGSGQPSVRRIVQSPRPVQAGPPRYAKKENATWLFSSIPNTCANPSPRPMSSKRSADSSKSCAATAVDTFIPKIL
jgi:hypothetical protein